MKPAEIVRVQQYLRDKFGTDRISLIRRPNADGSVEVKLGEEFVGVIYRDDEDGDLSYDFHMTILEIDLE